MSENRFRITTIPKSNAVAFDEKEKKYYIGIDFEGLLNDQQVTINELKEENKKLREEWEFSFRTELAHHRVAEKELQEKIRKQQDRICKLEQRDYYNQSERYKILGRAIELASDYIHRNDLEYYDFCGLVTEFEEELLEGVRRR